GMGSAQWRRFVLQTSNYSRSMRTLPGSGSLKMRVKSLGLPSAGYAATFGFLPNYSLVVFPDSAMYEISDRIARFALEAKLPSVSGWSSVAHKGLLMTYGPNVRELYRSLAGYVDKILRGAAAADLPFQAPITLYLAINQ